MQNSDQSSQSNTLYVHAYTITRSPTSFQKFNVVAVDRKGELPATVAVDMDFEDAAFMTEALNGSASVNEARNGDTGDQE
mgnify:FL=1